MFNPIGNLRDALRSLIVDTYNSVLYIEDNALLSDEVVRNEVKEIRKTLDGTALAFFGIDADDLWCDYSDVFSNDEDLVNAEKSTDNLNNAC